MSKNIYYPNFKLPIFFTDSLYSDFLKKYFDRKYDELDDNGEDELLSAIKEIVDSIAQNYGRASLIRMAIFLCRCVQRNIKWYDETDERSQLVISSIEACLDYADDGPIKKPVYSEVGTTGSQARDEAMIVFNKAVECLKEELIVDALVDMVEICITGYAIGPISDSDMPRDLFNWWLCDIVPSSIKSEEPRMLFYLDTEWPADITK